MNLIYGFPCRKLQEMGDPKNVRKERCELILVLLFAIRQPLIIFFQCGDSGDTLSISEKSHGNINSNITNALISVIY